MAFATASDGTRLWYSFDAKPHRPGTPLVLIPGLALDHHGWDSALEDFTDRDVIVLDHRGTGASEDHFPDEWSTIDFARDVIAVLDAAGVARAHVYGHSMGARIAQWLGSDWPDRVVSLVLGATTVGDETAVPRSAHASQVLTSGDAAALAGLLYADPWLRSHDAEVGGTAPTPASAEATTAHLAAVSRHDGPEPSAIHVPSLVIHGDDDELADPQNADLLANGIPHLERVTVAGARHVYWAGAPEAHERVREFLSRHDAIER